MNSVIHVDQLHRKVFVPLPVQRIISLVPSQTELLFDLGLEHEVVGITRFCVHPDRALKTKTIIGGTKKFNFEIIDQLRPDLIIGNKEENYKEGIAQLSQKYPVWMSDVNSIDEALVMIREIGCVTNRLAESAAVINQIEKLFATIRKHSPLRVLYLIWKGPWMAAGGGTFIHSLITATGWTNVLQDASRYPALTEEKIQQLAPDVILLSSEPFPFKESDGAHLKAIVPRARIAFVDGEMFSWYGSRLIQVPAYLGSLL
jgi:ABC-type Fe3+-hydroxamate transport system substrate-binding protein